MNHDKAGLYPVSTRRLEANWVQIGGSLWLESSTLTSGGDIWLSFMSKIEIMSYKLLFLFKGLGYFLHLTNA